MPYRGSSEINSYPGGLSGCIPNSRYKLRLAHAPPGLVRCPYRAARKSRTPGQETRPTLPAHLRVRLAATGLRGPQAPLPPPPVGLESLGPSPPRLAAQGTDGETPSLPNCCHFPGRARVSRAIPTSPGSLGNGRWDTRPTLPTHLRDWSGALSERPHTPDAGSGDPAYTGLIG